jgi:4-hydroxy-3-methylbut-2-enyl diphosphate reductase
MQRAVDKALEQARIGEPTCTLGELIHNTQIVEQLSQSGIEPIQHPNESGGRTVIIRSHGVAASVYQDWRELDAKSSTRPVRL